MKMTLKANPKLTRQLTLEGPMLLWRDKAGGGREGLLLTTYGTARAPGSRRR